MAAGVPAQQAPPATEVYLATLDPSAGITSWMNISNSPGYDNQPSFTPDSSAILFSSNRDGKQMDIYRYDIATKAVKQLTNTPDSEFSPAVTPDGKTFSVIRQAAADGTQLLVKYDLATGAHQSVVFENVKPSAITRGSMRRTSRCSFSDRPGQPATLQIGDTTTGTRKSSRRASAVDPDSPGQDGIVHHDWQPRMIKEFDPTTARRRSDCAVSRTARMRVDARRRVGDGCEPDDCDVALRQNEWMPLAILGPTVRMPRARAAGVRSVTRLAVSPDSKWLAFVAEPAK
jgi:hypothetical protein